VLGEIVQSLRDLSKLQITLQGIIYLQRISDPRVSGATRKSLRILELICGEEAFQYVVLVSTMWDRLMDTDGGYHIGESRERTLCETEEFWGSLRNRSAKVTRLLSRPGLKQSWDYGTHQHPWEIVMSLVKMPSPESLQIWHELEHGDKPLPLQETSAGRYLEQNVHKLQERYETELAMLEAQLNETRKEGKEGKEEMEELFTEVENYKRLLDDAEADLSRLGAINIDQLAGQGSGWKASGSSDGQIQRHLSITMGTRKPEAGRGPRQGADSAQASDPNALASGPSSGARNSWSSSGYKGLDTPGAGGNTQPSTAARVSPASPFGQQNTRKRTKWRLGANTGSMNDRSFNSAAS
jgi:hypothetical protein